MHEQQVEIRMLMSFRTHFLFFGKDLNKKEKV